MQKGAMESMAGSERFDKLYGDIPGSKPDWRGSNIKTKGKAAVECIPPARLGQTGWAAWTSFQDPKPGFGRRHYHDSPLAQTVAKSSLPCVDSAAAASCCSANLQLSGSLSAAYQEQRRHRRMISTPPEMSRPQGKKMVAKHASVCRDLLKDPVEPVASSSAVSSWPVGASATAVCMQSGSSTAANNLMVPTGCTSERQLQHEQQHGGGQHVLPALAADVSSSTPSLRNSTRLHKFSVGGYHGQSVGSSSTTSSSSGVTATAQVTTSTDVVPAAGDLNSGRTGVPPRVQDNPDYFRTLKDPPAFQRFCASVAARNPAKPAGSSTAARHEIGLQHKQRAAVELAKREVAALQID